MNKNTSHVVLFVGDTHFHLTRRPGEQKRLERFLLFLDMARQADELVLLGDIFDFWIDYPHLRLRGYDEILHGLDAVRAAGTTVHFIGGNHDIWAAEYFHERYGTNRDGASKTLDLDGFQMRLVHGDGLLARDTIYNGFRWLVRQRAAVAMAKSLHPELLYHFCCWLSGTSRKASRDESDLIVERARRYLDRTAADWDMLLIGHVHHAFLIENEQRAMGALGSWFGEESYGIWSEGRFALKDFANDPRPI
jgi:UDP-2,3-diacylglucosamine hydrolase